MEGIIKESECFMHMWEGFEESGILVRICAKCKKKEAVT